MSQTKSRIEFIHLLRAIAPIFVLWAHIPGWWLADRGQTWVPYEATRTLVMSPLMLFQEGGHYGVIVFFLISGFIISHVASRETRTEFLIKRIFRIWPTVAFAVLVMWVLQHTSTAIGLNPVIGDTARSGWDYFLSATLLNWFIPDTGYAISVTWSLMPEVVFYATILAAIPILRTKAVAATAVVLAASLIVPVMPMIHPALAPIAVNGIYLPVFLVGRILYLWSAETAPKPVLLFLLLGCFSAFMVLAGQISPRLISEGWTTYLLALATFVAAMAWNPSSLPKPVAFFADISYPLYLLHVPVGAFALNVLTSLGWAFTFSYPIALMTIVAVSWASLRLIDRPSQAAARALLKRNPPINALQSSP